MEIKLGLVASKGNQLAGGVSMISRRGMLTNIVHGMKLDLVFGHELFMIIS
jgi:hypothetical protein